MTGARLRYVVLHLGKQHLHVVVDDPHNRVVREIAYNWAEKDAGNIPPKGWADSVHGEVEFQRGQAQSGARDLTRFQGGGV